MSDLQSVFHTWGDAARAEAFERDEEIDCLMRAWLSRTNYHQHGGKGTGKSFLGNRMFDRISGAEIFKLTFNTHTAEKHVMGPDDIDALLNENRQVRRTKGFLPEADAMIADELYKGSNVVNCLLLAGNERQYEEDGERRKIPLQVIISMSNELPEDASFLPLYDRFLQRSNPRPIQSRANRKAMMRARAQGLVLPEPDKIIDLSQIKDAQKQAMSVDVPDDVLDMIDVIATELWEEHNISVSNRRQNDSVLIAQAEAWLKGREFVLVSDLRVLQNIFWDDPKQIVTVSDLVLNKVDPDYRLISDLVLGIGDLAAQVEKTIDEADAVKRARSGNELRLDLHRAANDIRAWKDKPLSANAKAQFRKSQLTLKAASERLLVEVQGLSPDIAAMQADIILKGDNGF